MGGECVPPVRKPIDLLTLHGGAITDYICDKECPIARPGRIKVDESEPVCEYQAKYSDIDINGHVNSIKYIEHILDLFPMEMFREKSVRRFEMAYGAESRERIRYRGEEEQCGSSCSK